MVKIKDVYFLLENFLGRFEFRPIVILEKYFQTTGLAGFN